MRPGRIRWGRWLLFGGAAAVVLLAALFLWQPVMVELYHYRARRALGARDNQQALEELRAALRLAPDGAETHFLLARTYRRLGDLEKVGALLRRAEKLGGDPGRVKRETWLVSAQLGHLGQAEPHLGDLLADPRDDGADIYEAYVQGYFSNLRVAEAVRLLDAWQDQYPQDPQPHFMRGYLLQALARWRESAVAYRRGLEMAPGQTAMRLLLAQVLMEIRKFDEVDALLRRCAEEDPQNPEVLTTWAECLSKQGRADQARPLLQQAVEKAPGHFEARRLLGELEISQGRFEEALGHLEAAVVQRPYDTRIRNALGQALRALGRTDEAKPHFDYVAEAEGPLHRLEKPMRLVLERPDDVELRYEIGATLLKYGSPDDGVNWLRTVLRLEPGHQGAHQALAAYYQARGDRQRASFHRAQLDSQ